MAAVHEEHARVAQFLGVPALSKGNFLSLRREKDIKIDTAAQAEQLITSQIDRFDNMEVLELCMNSIGVEASMVIGASLAAKPELKKHMLNGIQLAGARLVYLNLSDNALGPSVIDYYKEFLQSEACFCLKYLNLNNCGMGISIAKVADALVECQRRSSEAGLAFQLHTFIAGRNRLENPGALALARAFAQLRTLRHVSLPQDGILTDGVKALAKAFAVNVELQVVDMADNTFLPAGAKAMCRALRRLPNVHVLNFADCCFKTKGGAHFLEAMRSGLNELMEIDLSGNDIDANIAKQLLDCVKQKSKLKQLKIGTNRYGRQLGEIRSVASSMGQLAIDVGDTSNDEGTASEAGEDADESSGAQSDDELSDGPPALAAQIANALVLQQQIAAASTSAQSPAGVDRSTGSSGAWNRLGPKQTDVSHSSYNGTHNGVDASGDHSYIAEDDEDVVVDEQIVLDFLDSPTYEVLESLYPDAATYFLYSKEMDHITSDPVRCVDLIFILSSLITRSHPERVPLVGSTLDTLLLAAHAVSDDQPVYGPMDPDSMIVNHLIARLGLVKVDRDAYRHHIGLDNCYGLFRALTYLARDGEHRVFDTTRDTLRFWLGRAAKPGAYDPDTMAALGELCRALND